MLLNESLFMNELESPKTNSKWTKVKSKSVRDSDGFMTDYTWYTDGDEHICIFGDIDLYTPENSTPDVDGYFGEAGAEAMAQWFNSYVGPGDDESLQEAFSSSMPSWLTRYIQTNKQVREALQRRGFDFSNLEFVRIPRDQIPTKSTDPIFKDETKQLVYLLRDEKKNIVYLPGVGANSGDDDVFLERGNLTKSTKLKYLSIKQLISITVLMGYIENSDANKNLELRKERSDQKTDMLIRGKGQYSASHNRYPHKEDGSTDWDHPYKEYTWVMSKGEDKSGYKLNPTKYKDMLDQADMHTYGRQFDRYSKKLELLRSAIIEYITSMDVKRGMSTSWGTTISRVMREFEDALNEFKNIQTRIQDILENPELDDESKNKRISYVFDGEYGWNGIANLRDHLETAWKYLNEVKVDDERRARYHESIEEKLQLNHGDEHIQTVAKRLHDEVSKVSSDLTVSVLETGTGIIIYDGTGTVDFKKVEKLALEQFHSDNYDPEIFKHMTIPGGAQCILIDKIRAYSKQQQYNEALHGIDEINKFFELAQDLGYVGMSQMKHLLDLGKKAGWSELETLMKAKHVFGNKIPDTLVDGLTDEFLDLAKDVGMIDETPEETQKSYERFIQQEVEPGETYTQAIRRYRDELIDSGVDVEGLRRESERLLKKWSNSILESVATGKNGRYLVQVFDEGDWHDLNRWSTAQKAHEQGQKAVDAVYQDYRVIDRETEEEVLLEGVMSELAYDVDEAGGDRAYVELKTKELEEFKAEYTTLQDQCKYLDKYARREIGRGGAYDSISELEDDIEDIEDRLTQLQELISDYEARIAIVKRSIH